MSERLTRSTAGLDGPAPVRLVHLGLGSFFRAHQAWYTDRADDSSDWGIAAFTGRSARLSQTLTEQEGIYTLLERGASGSSVRHIGSISSAHEAANTSAWLDHLSAPEVSIVTVTVTEAAYRRAADGSLDLADPDVADDVAALRRASSGPVKTVPGRLLAGLMARRSRGAPGRPLSVVPCDNLSENGAAVRSVLTELATAVDPTLLAWLDDNVEFVDTMVDRITPAPTASDAREVAELTGLDDRAVVVTESFSEWVLAGEFPGGRPDWESAGARIVTDVAPYERRKLWLLNGAHSLIAYVGSLRGHETVAEAVGDPQVRAWVGAWWDEAAPRLAQDPREVADYCFELMGRFDNPHLRHQLSQIAADGSQKLPVRVAPVLRESRADGRMPTAGARIVAAWTLHAMRRGTAPVSDAGLDVSGVDADSSAAEAVTGCLRLVAPDLGDDLELRRETTRLVDELSP